MSKVSDVNLFLPQARCLSNKAWVIIGTPIRCTNRVETVATTVYVAYTPIYINMN